MDEREYKSEKPLIDTSLDADTKIDRWTYILSNLQRIYVANHHHIIITIIYLPKVIMMIMIIIAIIMVSMTNIFQSW